ncbi:LysR family transcriptional regulator [Ihubacter sp. rT4E-8]|uniref:LysR family transcriptional regulator n=1 Tax=Ihubacter sp. rT4E-8 TaxID=3242369 RepID=UPI003CEBAD33
MNYRTIEIFLDLVQTRNITKTAQRLYLAQSTVSKRLAALEEELGYSLIQRTKGRREILLTRQGEQFISVAERWKNLFEETESLKNASLSTIMLGISESSYYGFIAPFLRRFMEAHPDIRIVASIYNSDQIYQMMDNHMLDYGITAYESERAGISNQCISRQKLCLIRYSAKPEEGQVISAAALDPAKEIRFTGGNFRSMNHWRKTWFSGKNESRLELNTVQGIVPFLDGTDYWAVCTPSMAASIARNVSLQIYQMEDCADTWELFFLKREGEEAQKTTAAMQFEAELFAYVEAFSENE